MTALREYDRLEASGLWRASPEEQRREVIVSIGDATLVITDMQDRALTHWSLAAVRRQNPGHYPATYNPDGDPGETLELARDETAMIEAIEKLRRAVERVQPKPGRLRGLGAIVSITLVVLMAVFWLPDALLRHTVSVVPDIKRAEIGEELLRRIERIAGRPCRTRDADASMARLAARTGVTRALVFRDGVQTTLHLPGGIVLLNKALVEDFEDPAVVAGYILAERVRAEQDDPLETLLRHAGVKESFRLITTGDIDSGAMETYAEDLLLAAPRDVPTETLLSAFRSAEIPSTPYAYAVDVTGETVLGLIEADPMTQATSPAVLEDRDWVLLQSICGG